MIDDPLALVAAGIWLMSAGMYPLGFLFGACSDCCQQDAGCCCNGDYPSQLVFSIQGVSNRVNDPGYWFTGVSVYEQWASCANLDTSLVIDFEECSQATTSTVKQAVFEILAPNQFQPLLRQTPVRYKVSASYNCQIVEGVPTYLASVVVETGFTPGVQPDDANFLYRNSEFDTTYSRLIFSTFTKTGAKLPSGNFFCEELGVVRRVQWNRTLCSTGTASRLQHVFNDTATAYELQESGGVESEDVAFCETNNTYGFFPDSLGCDLSTATVTVTLQ